MRLSISPYQEGILYDQLFQNKHFYNTYMTLMIYDGLSQSSKTDIIYSTTRLLQILFDRHDTLRFFPKTDSQGFYGEVKDNASISLKILDFKTSSNEEDNTNNFLQLIEQCDSDVSFRLTEDTCHPVYLILCMDKDIVAKSWVVPILHHYFIDGFTSTFNLYNEWNKLKSHHNPSLPSLFSFVSYCQETPSYDRELQQYIDDLQHYKDHITDLPLDRPRTTTRHFDVWIITQDLDVSIQEVRSKHRLTLYMFSLYCSYLFLFLISGQDQINIGGTTSNAPKQYPTMVGMFTNMIVYSLQRQEILSQMVSSFRQMMQHTLSLSMIPFHRLVSHLHPNTDLSNGVSPLFQVMVNYMMSYPALEHYLKQSESMSRIVLRTFSIFDLNLCLYKQDNRLRIECRFKRDIFDYHTALSHTQRWKHMIEQVPHASYLSDLCLLFPEDVQTLSLWTPSLTPYTTSSVQSIIKTRVLTRSTDLAVLLDSQSLTYAQLWTQAQQCAFLLRQSGVRTGDIVVQQLPRSLHMIIGFLGILLAGAVYCPVSCSDPPERVQIIYTNSKATCLLDLGFIRRIQENTPEWTEPTETELLYVAHTSGSTGVPKGACITHDAYCNLYYALLSNDLFASTQRVLQFSAITFDPHIREILITLMRGKTIVMLDNDKASDPEYITSTVQNQQVDLFPCTPSFFRVITDVCSDPYRFNSVRLFSFTGEPLKGVIVQRIYQLAPLSRIMNVYGPVELTCDTTIHLIRPQPMNDSEDLPIGLPILNCQCYIMKQGIQVPPGQVGELYVGGRLLMKEYLHNPEQTNKVIIQHSLYGRLYKTGDLVRLISGQLFYVGRTDFQIKIRGQRLELGEIESVLRSFASVRDALVVKQSTDHLVAYVLSDQDLHEENIRSYCARYLLSYMIPDRFVSLTHWPLNANGKINRKALPLPLIPDNTSQHFNYSEREGKLCQSLSGLTGKSIDLDTPLYSLGLDSFLFIKWKYLLKEQVDLEFDFPTLRSVKTLRELNATLSLSQVSLIPTLASYGPATTGQTGMMLHERFHFKHDSSVYHIHFEFQVQGILAIERLQQAYKILLLLFPAFRTSFEWKRGKGLSQSIQSHYDFSCIFTEHFGPDIYSQSFDLKTSPLCRIFYQTQNNQVSRFLIQLHHIIYDHGCDSILFSTLREALQGRAIYVPSFTMIDVALYEQKNPLTEQARLFWTSQLQPEYAFSSIIPAKPIKTRSGKAQRSPWTFTSTQSLQIRQWAARAGCSVHDVCLTLLSRFLHHFGSKDLTYYIGSPYHNRDRSEWYNVMGYMMNLVAYPSTYTTIPLEDHILQSKHLLLQTQPFSFYNIQSIYSFPSSKGLPFCSMVFTEVPLQHIPTIHTSDFQLTLEWIVEGTQTAVFPFALFMTQDTIIRGWWEWDVELYHQHDIQSITQSFIEWCNNII